MRKIIPVVAAGVTTLALAGGALSFANASTDVTLSVDGQARDVATTAGTVGDLLDREGLAVTDRDLVAPAPDTRLEEGTRIAVRFAREVRFTVDGKPHTIWTTATTVDQAVSALGMDTAGAALSTSRSSTIGRQGLDVDIATEKRVTILAAGKKVSLDTTETTVAGALAEANISVDGNDKLSAAPTTRLVDGSRFSYTRVDVSSSRSKQAVGFDVVRTTSSKLDKGKSTITRRGVAGQRTVTYRVVKHNGKVVSRTKVGVSVNRKPVSQLVTVGTRVPKSPSTGSGSGSVSGGVWDKIAQCESGGNWSINTGNGYYGGLQFSLSTWRAYGGSGMPHQAGKAQQIAIAKKVQAAQGWGAWPACTAKLGLR